MEKPLSLTIDDGSPWAHAAGVSKSRLSTKYFDLQFSEREKLHRPSTWERHQISGSMGMSYPMLVFDLRVSPPFKLILFGGEQWLFTELDVEIFSSETREWSLSKMKLHQISNSTGGVHAYVNRAYGFLVNLWFSHNTGFCMHGRAYHLNDTLCLDGPGHGAKRELKLLVFHEKEESFELLNLPANQTAENEMQNSIGESRGSLQFIYHDFSDMMIWALELNGGCYAWIPREKVRIKAVLKTIHPTAIVPMEQIVGVTPHPSMQEAVFLSYHHKK